MHSPDYFLKELLFDFDCVTIPGFGGFIMQSQPARIERVKHRIYPPARYPSFNSLLHHDDGLLISRVAKSGNISYSRASDIVREYADNLKKRISQGEIVAIEGVGKLLKNSEGAIIFKPTLQANFLAGSFGLESMNLFPVSRAPQNVRAAQKHPDRTARDFREKKPAAVKWTLALSLPVIIFLLYGIIFPLSIQKIYTNYSGIVLEMFQPKKAEPAVLPELHEVKTFPVPAKNPDIMPAREVSTTPVAKSEINQPAVVQQSQKYYIIGGCFEKEENAKKFLDGLLQRGFDAEQAGATKRGHLRISYKSFTEKDPALSYLQKIRDEENASAWILKY